MKKKAIAAVCAVAILCGALSGCVGYDDHTIAGEGLTQGENLALNKDAKLLATSEKTKDAKKSVDGKTTSGAFASREYKTIEVDLGEKQTFNTIVLREKGWNVRYFHIEIETMEGRWETIYEGDRIESMRYCALEKPATASKLRLVVDSSLQAFTIAEIAVSNETAQVNRDEVFVTGYVRTQFMQNGEIYDTTSSMSLDKEYFNSVNELNFLGGVTIGDNGTIVVTETAYDAQGKEIAVPSTAEKLGEAVKRLREYFGDRKVQLTITLNTTSDHEKSHQAMTKYKDEQISNIMKFLEITGFDGISYDWERPANQEQFDGFSDYLIELKPLLAEKNKRLTLAWAAWSISMKPEAVAMADAIEIMSYDLFDQYGNQASFMESTVQAVEYFLDIGYSPKQLHIGIPYYGRPDSGAPEWPSYDDPRYHFSRYNDADNDFISDGLSYFNSAQSVADKTAYAISRGLGGVMVFRLELDRPYQDETCLTKSIENMLDQRTVKGGA